MFVKSGENRGKRMAAGLILLLSLLFVWELACADYDGVSHSLTMLEKQFPDGKHWNHYVSTPAEGRTGYRAEFFSDSVTDHCCSVHGQNAAVGQYICNSFDYGIQCYGFANRILYGVFGQKCSGLRRRTDIENIRVGDHVRFKTWGSGGHSAIVWRRDGNTLTLYECNLSSDPCVIFLGRKVELFSSGICGFYQATNWDQVNNSHTVSYTITYNANGGSGSPDGQTQRITTLDPVMLYTDTPTRRGYDFLGWADTPTATEVMYKAGDIYSGEDITLYAVWKLREYTVTFDYAGGSGTVKEKKVGWGQPVGELPAAEKQYFTFLGWVNSRGYTVSADMTVGKDITLTARWEGPARAILSQKNECVEEDAFRGSHIRIFVVTPYTRRIDSGAFADNSDLVAFVCYSRTVYPADDAFENCPNLVIYGFEDDQIYNCAKKMGIPFVALTGDDWFLEDHIPEDALRRCMN